MSMSVASRVKELNLPLGSYAVFGSGPLEAHGIREAHNIDILVTEELFRTLKKDEATWKLCSLHDMHESLKKGEDVEVYYSWAPDSWDIPAMIKEADMIDGVPFVKLETVMEWKKIRNHPKDARDIALITEYLAKNK